MATLPEQQAPIPKRISIIDSIVAVCALGIGVGFGLLSALHPMGEMSQQTWSTLVQNMTFGTAILAGFPCYMCTVYLHRQHRYVQGWTIWAIGFCLVGMTVGSSLSYFVTR